VNLDRSLDALWRPRSVAIVGASDNPARFGGRPIQFLLQSGFEGHIYPVNPGRAFIQGLPVFPSIDAIGAPVDCAIISVPTEAVAGEVARCARVGVRAAIIFSAGFAEIGPAGELVQQEIVQIARAAGMRLLGPNCMGLFNAHARFCPTFASTLEEGMPSPGRIGLVSQSGGYGGYVLRHFKMRDIQLGYWITTGNEADIDVGEVMNWMAHNDEVDVIVGYLEGLRSAGNFVNALRIAHERRKPIVLMKVGRTAEGSEAAKSHTASLTGEDAVYDSVLEQYGVHRARTTEELVDIAYAASKGRWPTGRRVGIVSISGGIGVQMADYVADGGLDLSATPDSTQDKLRNLIPACSPRNPIDLTGLVTADRHLLREATELVLKSRAFDAVVIFIGITAMAPSMGQAIRDAILAGSRNFPEQLLIVSLTADPSMVKAFDESGFFVFEDPARAVHALSALVDLSERFDRTVDRSAPGIAAVRLPAPGDRINEVEAKALLARYGIRTPREILVRSAREAGEAAARIGCPVAIKVVSADIPHKSDVGGVALDIRQPSDAVDAVQTMRHVIANRLPDAVIEGFLVSEMVSGGVEMLLGMRRDPVFGPVVAVGLGGVHVELFNDVRLRVGMVSIEDALGMIRQLNSYPMLDGYRGAEPADVPALACAVAAFSRLAMEVDPSVTSLEINPLVVLDRGKGAIALDAAVEINS